MACGRYADGSALHFARPAADHGDDLVAFNADTRLDGERAGRLQRLHLDDHVDRRVPHHQHARAQVQARITDELSRR